MLIRIIIFAIVIVFGVMLYIRFAPTRVDQWHKAPLSSGAGDYQSPVGFRAERKLTASTQDALRAAEQRALATPRTKLIAGSVDKGMLTFETRSLIMGFPDYTTITAQDGVLIISGRLRFGKSDMGVNKARIVGWLETLAPLTEPL
ncbi:DUF1499 domain-containing protein [Yoonia maritima]|uniref:DUF1499 domain-containing protein n=1 Tax=Yoonia maritima TaxID=1435347 RepID=UPI001EF863F4|nr:DUF1499 domain-containing protein [Yoonia maritima]